MGQKKSSSSLGSESGKTHHGLSLRTKSSEKQSALTNICNRSSQSARTANMLSRGGGVKGMTKSKSRKVKRVTGHAKHPGNLRVIQLAKLSVPQNYINSEFAVGIGTSEILSN